MTVDRFGADEAEEGRQGSTAPEGGRPHEKQIISYCEMALDRNHLKSRDPSDQALASLERAAPPSPAGPQPRRARLPRPVQTAARQFGAAGLGPQAGAPSGSSSMSDARSASRPSQHPYLPRRGFETPRSFLREQRASPGAWAALKKQNVSYCEMVLTRNHLKSGDPSDQALASFEPKNRS